MLNDKKMSLELPRIKMCDLMMACTGIVIDCRNEYNDPSTSESRRRALEGTIAKWQNLHDEIKRQLEAFDAENAEG